MNKVYDNKSDENKTSNKMSDKMGNKGGKTSEKSHKTSNKTSSGKKNLMVSCTSHVFVMQGATVASVANAKLLVSLVCSAAILDIPVPTPNVSPGVRST